MTRRRLIIVLVLTFIGGLVLGGVVDHTYFKEEGQTFEYPGPYIEEGQSLGYPGPYIPPRGNPSNWKTFDEDGIVMKDYGGKLGKQYQPVDLCQYALANYNYYVSTGKKQYKQELLKQTDWLVEKQVITPKGFGVWYYEFDWITTCECHAPWISSMAQGEAISVLVRAYALTQDKKYLETAKLAVGAFEHSVDDGGVRFVDEDGNVFYLEYACEPYLCVLNGFIYSLFGVHDYYQTTGSQEALVLFNDGIKTLKVKLKGYDTGDWTYYDLIGNKASASYHRTHCYQLFQLYFITGDRYFLEYAEKWYSYVQQ